MLHSPVSENKTKDRNNKNQSEPESQSQNRSLGWAGYPSLDLGGEKLSQSGKERAQGWKPLNLSSLSQGGILQRKCACGNSAGSPGTCTECQKKEEMPLQRKNKGTEAGNEAPPIVHEVLNSPGQPLDTETRTFMESRFGQDFSQVRVHTDGKATESAKAVNALAYTVGNNVVFSRNQYTPENIVGKKLLAHELTHVVQQKNKVLQSKLEIGNQSDPYEQEADRNAEIVAQGLVITSVPTIDNTVPIRLQKQELTPDTDSQPKKVCGPDVTKQVKDALLKTRTKFLSSWSDSRKEDACEDLVSVIWGWGAWDILELNENDWIFNKYNPVCASEGASPSCIKSVQVDNECFYAGSVNYVLYGSMFYLCNEYYATASPININSPFAHAYPLPTNKRFTLNEMLKWIDWYKGKGLTGLQTPRPNFKSSNDWALAGFHNWPDGALTPPGDRSNCSPTCRLPYWRGTFTVNWSGENF